MSINNVAAFQGWNSSLTSWNVGTWNTNVAYNVTATGSVGATTVTGDANVSVTGIAGTSAIGSSTVTGEANISPTGVAGTMALGNVFETQTGVAGTSAVGSVTITGVGNV